MLSIQFILHELYIKNWKEKKKGKNEERMKEGEQWKMGEGIKMEGGEKSRRDKRKYLLN